MSDKIKTRKFTKDIKSIDKSANIADKMKNAYIRTKDEAQYIKQSEHSSPSEYATDNATRGAEKSIYETGHQVKRQTVKIIDKAKEARNTQRATEKTIKTAPKVKKTIKQSAKSAKSIGKNAKTTAKGTIKITRKSIKTAEKTSKATIKTSQQTAKVAAKTAQATAKSAKVSVQAARATSKVAVQAAKTAAKATIATVKAIIAAIKGLTTLIAAGGWIAVVIILVICFVALIIGSCFGIFFSNESGANNTPMTQVISEITTEYYNNIEQIKTDHPSDIVDIISSDGVMAIKWDEVLAVYAVKTTTDANNSMEVATLDDNKINMLRGVFWNMNIITFTTETVEHEEKVSAIDVDGDEVMETVTTTEIILHITVITKSYSEMAMQYRFNTEQMEQLEELMKPEFQEMFSQITNS